MVICYMKRLLKNMSVFVESSEKKKLLETERHIDKMVFVLNQESDRLIAFFERYEQKSQYIKHKLPESKLIIMAEVLDNAKNLSSELAKLSEPLNNLKKINNMVLFSMGRQDNRAFIEMSSNISAVANVCLGHLKWIKSRLNETFDAIKQEITKIWMDREICEALGFIFFLNQSSFDQFFEEYKNLEIIYADLSLVNHVEEVEKSFDLRIVLRMISKKLTSDAEQNTINNLFPTWRTSIYEA